MRYICLNYALDMMPTLTHAQMCSHTNNGYAKRFYSKSQHKRLDLKLQGAGTSTWHRALSCPLKYQHPHNCNLSSSSQLTCLGKQWKTAHVASPLPHTWWTLAEFPILGVSIQQPWVCDQLVRQHMEGAPLSQTLPLFL